MSRNQPKAGVTRDYCRFCNGVIIYKFTDQSRRYPYWVHMDPEEAEHPAWCGIKREMREKYRRNESEPSEMYEWVGHKDAKPKSYCYETVSNSWYSSHCHRPVKDPDLFMCGIHARVVRDEEKRRKDWEENYELQQYISSQLDSVIQDLEEEFDIKAQKEYVYPREGGGRYTGKVTVDGIALLKLLRDMGNEERL